jgi:hypothetical protein
MDTLAHSKIEKSDGPAQITCFQKVASRPARRASLRAFQRRKWGEWVCSVCASRLSQTSWSRSEPGVSTERCKSYRRQPSSFRVGPTMPRSSASRMVSWPSRARSKTTNVTASLGSFVLPRERDRRKVFFLPERRDAARFAFPLAIMAGIVLQTEKTASGFLQSGRIRAQDSPLIFRRVFGRRSGCRS